MHICALGKEVGYDKVEREEKINKRREGGRGETHDK